ncbi:unnamed protein product [Vitrella brassicaformis CCMP3155]|uniref:Uncharacterized protein n=3 Tax=Vitrella brassicaformis TaxID=1169539 RepID=A0A0G4GLM0_VITBC|nr:unnamed protein product [Vitrella brassicaformis CCMP3155]|eukprot:CEM31011.1 unnamed protein product [Vitrella brassicaformis CCMP3155]
MSKRTRASPASQGLDDLTARFSQLAGLQQRVAELHRRVERVFELRAARDNSSESDHLSGQCAVLLSLLKTIAHTDSCAQTASLIRLAHTKCDFIYATLQRPSLSASPLIMLPESCFSDHICPLIGTRSTLTDLAPSYPSLHTISRKPTTHKMLHLGTDSARVIEMTQRQVAVWGAAFSKAKRAFMECAPSTGVVELLERASISLEELEAWSDGESVAHRLEPKPREGRGEIVFPVLTRVKLAGWWIRVADNRRWMPTSLVDVHLRDMVVQNDDVGAWDEPEKCSGQHSSSCKSWLAGTGPHRVVLEVAPDEDGRELAWQLEDLRSLVKPSIKQLKGVRCRPGVHSTRQELARVANVTLQLEELGVDTNEDDEATDTEMLEVVERLRSSWLAPSGIITFNCRPGVSFDVLIGLRRLGDCPSWAGTLTHLASLVTRVQFPSALAASFSVSYLLPQLVFSRAEKLVLCNVAASAGSEPLPLPDVFLSHISDAHFPRVATLDLYQVVGMRQEAVGKALDLKSIREVQFDKSFDQRARLFVPFFFPHCLATCSPTGPPLHIKPHFYSGDVSVLTGVWSLWEGGTGATSNGHQRGLEKRVQKISVSVQWYDTRRTVYRCDKRKESDESEDEGSDQGEDGGVFPVCLHAIDKCPLLDSIVLQRSFRSLSVDELGASPQPVKSQLLSSGFVAVQTGHDKVELYRVFGCLFPRWLAAHVSALSPCAIFAPRTTMDDAVSLPEALLAHLGLRFPRFIARHLSSEWQTALRQEVFSRWQ